MVWDGITRRQYQREGTGYASSLTPAEWAALEPCLPPPKRRGRPRVRDLRQVVDGLLYVLSTGCQWRALPKDFPPRSTVQGYFYRWRDAGVWAGAMQTLVRLARSRQGRRPAPSAGVIDSQSVATTQAGGPRGLDPFKRIKGRKRHIVTDTDGLLLAVQVHPANIQDCHGAVPLIGAARQQVPSLRLVFADRVYRGAQLIKALGEPSDFTVEIVKRPNGVKGFQLLPRRWVVERTFAWLGRCRRLSRDFEATIASATAWICLAHIRLLTRRLARPQPTQAL